MYGQVAIQATLFALFAPVSTAIIHPHSGIGRVGGVGRIRESENYDSIVIEFAMVGVNAFLVIQTEL